MRRMVISLVAAFIMAGLSLTTSWAESASDWFNRGKEAYEASQYETAADYYSKAIELDPELLKGYFNRGLSLFRLKKWSDARADFRVVCTADSSDHEAFSYIGLTYLKEGKNNEALAEFQKAAAIEERPDYFLNSASALFNEGKYHATIQFCDTALRLSPDPETEGKIQELKSRAEMKKREALEKSVSDIRRRKKAEQQPSESATSSKIGRPEPDDRLVNCCLKNSICLQARQSECNAKGGRIVQRCNECIGERKRTRPPRSTR